MSSKSGNNDNSSLNIDFRAISLDGPHESYEDAMERNFARNGATNNPDPYLCKFSFTNDSVNNAHICTSWDT
jgi:hypothetical protein